jgi:hypothetical protein
VIAKFRTAAVFEVFKQTKANGALARMIKFDMDRLLPDPVGTLA